MSGIQWTVRVLGLGLILIGIFGFSAAGGTAQADPMEARRMFGVFPAHAGLAALHVLLGLWALFAYHAPARARTYALAAGPLLLLLALLGLAAPSLFGLAPIGENNVWLHAAIGLVLTGAGFAARGTPPPANDAGSRSRPGRD